MRDAVKVMFVCTGNSARSQMAEGFARHFGKGRMEACSAGMEPSRLNAFAVAVMREKGIDISDHHSKAFDWDLARQMDVVVTVCGHANESCPVLPPEVMRLHWPLEDPAAATGTEAEISAKFREIRDQIEGRVRDLIHGIQVWWRRLVEDGSGQPDAPPWSRRRGGLSRQLLCDGRFDNWSSKRRRNGSMADMIIIYGTDTWPFCSQARAAYGDRATYVNVSQHPEKLAEILAPTGGRQQVPVMVEGNKVTVGFAGEASLRGGVPLFGGTWPVR